MHPQWHPHTIIGCMSGTSCDGVDVVLLRWQDRPQIVAHVGYDWGELAGRVRAVADGAACTAAHMRELMREISQAHLQAINQLPSGLLAQAQMLAVHGQTIYHAPPLSWQMLDAPWLAAQLGVPVLHDLRSPDLAAGGQGAPITPLADSVLFPGQGTRAVANLGGFINCTLLQDQEVVAGDDVCLANQLLDRAARSWLDQPMDKDGACAATGQVHDQACQEIFECLRNQCQGRSLGSADQQLAWIDHWRPRLAPANALATLCRGIALCLHAYLEPHAPHTLWLAGGGVANATLLEQIRQACPGMRVASSAQAGVPPAQREAAAMAILGRRLAQGQAITLPGVTGCRQPAPIGANWSFP